MYVSVYIYIMFQFKMLNLLKSGKAIKPCGLIALAHFNEAEDPEPVCVCV